MLNYLSSFFRGGDKKNDGESPKKDPAAGTDEAREKLDKAKSEKKDDADEGIDASNIK